MHSRQIADEARLQTPRLHVAQSTAICMPQFCWLMTCVCVQSSKLSVNDVVAAEPVHSLPPASLVVLQVSRLRPKGADEARFETSQLCSMFEHLQGVKPAAPGMRPCRWPATVGHEMYLTEPPLILGCKVRFMPYWFSGPPLWATSGISPTLPSCWGARCASRARCQNACAVCSRRRGVPCAGDNGTRAAISMLRPSSWATI